MADEARLEREERERERWDDKSMGRVNSERENRKHN